MADPTQLELLRRSVAEWNEWKSKHQKAEVDLHGANLSGATLGSANLRFANLGGTNFGGTNLRFANLRFANLRFANLRFANLSNADLSNADLSNTDLRSTEIRTADIRGADLSNADLSGVNLSNADLSGTILANTNLSGTNLSGTNISDASIGYTAFGDRDFRQIKGLDAIKHLGPSPLSINSLYLSVGEIPEDFVRRTGAPDAFIEYMHALTTHPIEYYTCFISYSSKDEAFAQRLYADLQYNGVRCWFAPRDMRPGTVIVRGIDEAIRLHDKLLLVLSQHSVESTWVEFEVAAALEKEKDQRKDVLFPIRLDETILTTKQAWASGIRRQRHIGDFTQWKNHDTYQQTFDRLLRDLKQEKA